MNLHSTQNEGDKNDNDIQCHVCKKNFKRTSALYYHIRRIHKIAIEFVNRKNKFKCPSCSVTFQLNNLLRNHIQDVHNVQIQMCEEYFHSYEEFKSWKDAEQDKTKSLYTSCQNIRCDKYRRYFYACYRSGGFLRSKSSGKRKLTPKKIDGWCPAGIEVKAFNEGGVRVKYWMTHFGHECEVDCLNLTRNDKVMIAQKLQEGLSIEKILDDVRQAAVVGDDIKRIDLLSRRDIINISKSFKISKKDTPNKDEDFNINAWVQGMETLGKDSPVIFFKKKHSEHIMLKNYDYLLVIMTKVQQKLLENCSHNIVCLDDIRITLTYNFHVVTLMTIDDSDIACPLAYGIANKIDENVISLILEIINSKVGRITTNIFMSSDIPAFYSTWQKHMDSKNTFLLSHWQIDKDWRKALEKLSCSKEKKGRVYKILKQVMIEPNFKLFCIRLENALKQLEADTDLKSFSETLRTKYCKRSELWASCYRSQQVLHYSAILESVHKSLVECYEEGRVSNSFVKPLNSIFRFSRVKVLEKLQKLPKEFQMGNLGNICLSNEDIQEIALTKTPDVSEKLLPFPVVENDGCFVEYNAEYACPHNCVLLCTICIICFHKFTCTCVENFVNLNVCSHILASINMLKKQCSHIHTNEDESTSYDNPDVISIQCDGGAMTIANEEIVESTRDKSIDTDTVKESETVINVNEGYYGTGSFANFDVGMREEFITNECSDKEQNVENCIEGVVEVGCSNKKDTTQNSARRNTLVKECNIEINEEPVPSTSESYKSLLLQKVTFINDMFNSRTFNPEEYKLFDEYLDKIIVVSNYSEIMQ